MLGFTNKISSKNLSLLGKKRKFGTKKEFHLWIDNIFYCTCPLPNFLNNSCIQCKKPEKKTNTVKKIKCLICNVITEQCESSLCQKCSSKNIEPSTLIWDCYFCQNRNSLNLKKCGLCDSKKTETKLMNNIKLMGNNKIEKITPKNK